MQKNRSLYRGGGEKELNDSVVFWFRAYVRVFIRENDY